MCVEPNIKQKLCKYFCVSLFFFYIFFIFGILEIFDFWILQHFSIFFSVSNLLYFCLQKESVQPIFLFTFVQQENRFFSHNFFYIFRFHAKTRTIFYWFWLFFYLFITCFLFSLSSVFSFFSRRNKTISCDHWSINGQKRAKTRRWYSMPASQNPTANRNGSSAKM